MRRRREGWLGGRTGGEELDRALRRESQRVGTHNHHSLSHHFPIESLTSFLSFFLSLCFFTASLTVDFYCISSTPEGATGPQAPLFWRERERERERQRGRERERERDRDSDTETGIEIDNPTYRHKKRQKKKETGKKRFLRK